MVRYISKSSIWTWSQLSQHDNIFKRISFRNQDNYYSWLSFESYKPFWKSIVDFGWYFWNNLGYVFHDLSGSDVMNLWSIKNAFFLLGGNLSRQTTMLCGIAGSCPSFSTVVITLSHHYLNSEGIVMGWKCLGFDSRRFQLNRIKVPSCDHLSKGFYQICNCWTIRELYRPHEFAKRINIIETGFSLVCN